jgi:hypothetical protein
VFDGGCNIALGCVKLLGWNTVLETFAKHAPTHLTKEVGFRVFKIQSEENLPNALTVNHSVRYLREICLLINRNKEPSA